MGLPISASLAIVSTVSTCVSACLLLTSRKYKKKLLKFYELLDKITSSVATFEVLISLSIDDGTVIDAKEFHKLQTLYLQLMTYVRNIDRKMKVQTEESFQKYHRRNNEFKKCSGTKVVGVSLCMIFNYIYYKKDG